MSKKNKKNIVKNKIPYILIDICIIFLFIIGSYYIISSKYNFAYGDEGTYAYKTKILYEKHTLDLKTQAALSIGQLMIGYFFSSLFGYNLKILHISSYFTVFLCIIFFYLMLIQCGIERYLALIGSLTLFINPISIRLIDWYITEPYFLLYLLIAINFFIAGFRSDKIKYFYLGSIFATITVFTRQHGIFLPVSLISLLIIKRQHLKKYSIHLLLSSIVPIASLTLFYLFSSSQGDYATRIIHIKKLINPLYFASTLLKDALYGIHYSVIYTLPLILIIIFGAFIKREYLKDVFLNRPLAMAIASILISLGTIFVFLQNKKLMPFLPSIFSINHITTIFNIKILNNDIASIILTIFTGFCAILLLSRIIEHLTWKSVKKIFPKKNKNKKEILIRHFMYLNGIFYFLLSVITFLMYDRYIFPLAIFVIFFILIKFGWIANFKKMTLIIFLIIFSIRIFTIKCHQIKQEVLWDAGNLLISKGINPVEINGGCGFGFYHGFHEIKNIYKNIKINRPINWNKSHPMARYFLSSGRKQHSGLELIHSLSNRARFNAFKKKAYIYKRKANYNKPIWIR